MHIYNNYIAREGESQLEIGAGENNIVFCVFCCKELRELDIIIQTCTCHSDG